MACSILHFVIHSPYRVGTILVIPASVIVDWMVQKYLLPWQSFIGIGLIIIGFGGLTFSEFYTALREHKHEAKEKECGQWKFASQRSNDSSDSSPLLLDSDSDKITKKKWKKMIIGHLI